MAQNLTEDLNIVANSNLEIKLLDGDLNIIQKLDDEPNDVGGLTSAELKAKFDEAGNVIKTYINDTLIPAILSEDATEEARASAEAAREAAEQARASAEAARETAEQARVEAENGRVSAEAARVTAEQERAAAEQARADENTGIVAQATAQADAAEAAKKSAESAATSALSYKSAAYSSAVLAGQERGAAEQAKINAEAAQGKAEAAKDAASASETAAKASETAAAASADAAAASAARAEEVVGGDYATKTDLSAHTGNADIHVTAAEKAAWDGKAAGTHASQHASNGSDPITPASIGALPTSGGTMTGDLGVKSGQKISFQEYMAATKAYRDLSSIQFTPATGENFGTYDDGSGFGDTNLKEIILDTEIVKINKTADATPGIHMNGNRIAMVGEPVYREDAATKKYVDSAVGAKAPAYTYGTEDLTAGTSTLETGKLYFVYE